MKFNFVVVICFLFLINYSYSQTCCSGGIPLSNNIGLAILEKGTTQFGISYDYNNLNTLNSGSKKLDDNARLRITHSVLVNFNYAITNNFAVEGLFTWVNQRRKISQFGNKNLDETSGVGDALVLLKYNLGKFLGKNSNFNVGFGTKIPLGSSTKKSAEGITLGADLQPGSNAWDFIYYTAFSKNLNIRPSFSISSRLIYRSTGTNPSYFGDTTYKFGNEFQAFLGFSDQFVFFKTTISPSISIKYRNAQQDVVGGNNLDNTGGNWVFVVPDFSINVTPKILFSTKAEIPIYSNVDGTQLTPTYRLTFGFLITISPKKEIINLFKN
jgi:hypothetical protein